MKNIKELRDHLLQALDDLESGKLKSKDVKELTNISGKIIMTAKTQLDYNKFLGAKKKISFLDVDDECDIQEEKVKPKRTYRKK